MNELLKSIDILEYFFFQFSEDPHIFHEGSCPTTPAPDEVPRNACHQCECWSDANCDEQEKCCYNGCKNTCVDSVIVAPAAGKKRTLVRSNSWTSERQSSPVPLPHLVHHSALPLPLHTQKQTQKLVFSFISYNR